MGVMLCALIILLAPYQTHPILSSSVLGFTVIKWIGILALLAALPAYLRRLGGEERPGRAGFRKLSILFALASLSWLSWYRGAMTPTYSSCLSLAVFGFVLFMVVDRFSAVVFLTYSAVVAMFVSTLYIVKEVLMLRLQYGRFIRPFGGTFEDPNYFAVSGVVVLPLAYFLYRRGAGFWKRSAGAAMGGVILAGTIMTLSRGGLLGLTGIVVTTIFLAKARAKAFLTIALVAVIIFFAMPAAMKERIGNTRLARTSEEMVGDVASTTRRFTLYHSGLRMMLDHPFLGVGLGRFKEESLRYAPELGYAGVGHSTFVEIGAELGLAALILFAWIEIDCIRKARALQRKHAANGEIQLFMSCLIASVVGFVVSGAFVSAQYTKLHWFVVFLILILYSRMAAGEADEFLPAAWKTNPRLESRECPGP